MMFKPEYILLLLPIGLIFGLAIIVFDTFASPLTKARIVHSLFGRDFALVRDRYNQSEYTLKEVFYINGGWYIKDYRGDLIKVDDEKLELLFE